MESKEEMEKEIGEIKEKLKSKKLDKEDIATIGKLYKYAVEHNVSWLEEELDKLIPQIWEYIPAKEIEVKEGEVKKLYDDMLVTRKNGIIKLIFL